MKPVQCAWCDGLGQPGRPGSRMLHRMGCCHRHGMCCYYNLSYPFAYGCRYLEYMRKKQEAEAKVMKDVSFVS